jgi:hypothetical protein
LLHAVAHPADIQDRDGGVLMLSIQFAMYPFLLKLFLDGRLPRAAIPQRHGGHPAATLCRSRKTVGSGEGFECCREKLTRNAVMFLRLASIRLVLHENHAVHRRLSTQTLK